MTECKYCSFNHYSPNKLFADGKDIIDVSVWIGRDQRTGKISLNTYELKSREIFYCPMCGRKLGD